MPRERNAFQEIGTTGVKYSWGAVREEFLPELRGSRGIKTYREMADNDAIIGACLYAIKQILREARWDVEPYKEKDDKPSHSAEENADFLRYCMQNMSYSWNELILEALSMVIYGWSWFEIVYKRDKGSKKIVWKKFAPRLQSTLYKWDLYPNGTIRGFWQRNPNTSKTVFIPLQKSILFRTELAGDNPEGRSILRSAYRAWYFKKNLEEIEGIGVERDLAGLPVITPPDNFDIASEESYVINAIDWAKKLISNIRRDQQEGVFKPPGWMLELLSSPGKRQFDTTEIINRYNKEMAVTVLAQFIMLGMERTGSYALAKEQTDMFYLALEGWLNTIQTAINRYIVQPLFGLNGIFTNLPGVVHTSVTRFNLRDMCDYVSKLAGADALLIDDDVRSYLKNYARLSEFSDTRM